MHEGTPTVRDPRPAARVGYHMGKGLATTFARRIAATLVGSPQSRFEMAMRQQKNPPGEDPAGSSVGQDLKALTRATWPSWYRFRPMSARSASDSASASARTWR